MADVQGLVDVADEVTEEFQGLHLVRHRGLRMAQRADVQGDGTNDAAGLGRTIPRKVDAGCARRYVDVMMRLSPVIGRIAPDGVGLHAGLGKA